MIKKIYSSFIEDEALECTREYIIREEGYEPSDDEVYERTADLVRDDFEGFLEDRLKECFGNGIFLVVGSAGLWDGRHKGGKVLETYDDVTKIWSNYMDIEIFEETKGGYGEFQVIGHHHDGSDHWYVKKLTADGIRYYDKWNYNLDDKRSEEEVHNILWTNSHYSKNINFCKSTWGF